MKAIKKFFRFISLTVLYLGFSCLAGGLGFLLYGIARDFSSNNFESRGLASAPATSQKLTKTSGVKNKKPSPASDKSKPIRVAEMNNKNSSSSQTSTSDKSKPVTASTVKDKTSLKLFVLKAKEKLEKNYDKALEDFKTKNIWKTSFIYLTILDFSGNILFSANHPHLEGKNGMEWENVDGKKIIEDLVNTGKSGKGFYECRVRHPDTETLHPKLHYVSPFKKEGRSFIVFSGFFL